MKKFTFFERRKKTRSSATKSDEFLIHEDLKDMLKALAVVRKRWAEARRKGYLSPEEEFELFQPVMALYGIIGSSAEEYAEAIERLQNGQVFKVR